MKYLVGAANHICTQRIWEILLWSPSAELQAHHVSATEAVESQAPLEQLAGIRRPGRERVLLKVGDVVRLKRPQACVLCGFSAFCSVTAVVLRGSYLFIPKRLLHDQRSGALARSSRQTICFRYAVSRCLGNTAAEARADGSTRCIISRCVNVGVYSG